MKTCNFQICDSRAGLSRAGFFAAVTSLSLQIGPTTFYLKKKHFSLKGLAQAKIINNR